MIGPSMVPIPPIIVMKTEPDRPIDPEGAERLDEDVVEIEDAGDQPRYPGGQDKTGELRPEDIYPKRLGGSFVIPHGHEAQAEL